MPQWKKSIVIAVTLLAMSSVLGLVAIWITVVKHGDDPPRPAETPSRSNVKSQVAKVQDAQRDREGSNATELQPMNVTPDGADNLLTRIFTVVGESLFVMQHIWRFESAAQYAAMAELGGEEVGDVIGREGNKEFQSMVQPTAVLVEQAVKEARASLLADGADDIQMLSMTILIYDVQGGESIEKTYSCFGLPESKAQPIMGEQKTVGVVTVHYGIGRGPSLLKKNRKGEPIAKDDVGAVIWFCYLARHQIKDTQAPEPEKEWRVVVREARFLVEEGEWRRVAGVERSEPPECRDREAAGVGRRAH